METEDTGPNHPIAAAPSSSADLNMAPQKASPAPTNSATASSRSQRAAGRDEASSTRADATTQGNSNAAPPSASPSTAAVHLPAQNARDRPSNVRYADAARSGTPMEEQPVHPDQLKSVDLKPDGLDDLYERIVAADNGSNDFDQLHARSAEYCVNNMVPAKCHMLLQIPPQHRERFYGSTSSRPMDQYEMARRLLVCNEGNEFGQHLKQHSIASVTRYKGNLKISIASKAAAKSLVGKTASTGIFSGPLRLLDPLDSLPQIEVNIPPHATGTFDPQEWLDLMKHSGRTPAAVMFGARNRETGLSVSVWRFVFPPSTTRNTLRIAEQFINQIQVNQTVYTANVRWDGRIVSRRFTNPPSTTNRSPHCWVLDDMPEDNASPTAPSTIAEPINTNPATAMETEIQPQSMPQPSPMQPSTAPATNEVPHQPSTALVVRVPPTATTTISAAEQPWERVTKRPRLPSATRREVSTVNRFAALTELEEEPFTFSVQHHKIITQPSPQCLPALVDQQLRSNRKKDQPMAERKISFEQELSECLAELSATPPSSDDTPASLDSLQSNLRNPPKAMDGWTKAYALHGVGIEGQEKTRRWIPFIRTQAAYRTALMLQSQANTNDPHIPSPMPSFCKLMGSPPYDLNRTKYDNQINALVKLNSQWKETNRRAYQSGLWLGLVEFLCGRFAPLPMGQLPVIQTICERKQQRFDYVPPKHTDKWFTYHNDTLVAIWESLRSVVMPLATTPIDDDGSLSFCDLLATDHELASTIRRL